VLVVGLALVALAHVLDRPALFALLRERASLEQHDWYWLIRGVGDLRTWLVLALALVLLDPRPRRALALLLAPLAAGALAELAKLLIGRERPVDAGIVQNDGFYVWKPFLGAFSDSSNLGIPSSHAAVAFAGAAALALIAPRLAILTLPLAAACAWTRLAVGAHFLSDVVAGSLLGILMALAFRPMLRAPSGPGAVLPTGPVRTLAPAVSRRAPGGRP
jgi:undecaprenyl-diphosphatase